jgi:hypothetical protein
LTTLIATAFALSLKAAPGDTPAARTLSATQIADKSADKRMAADADEFRGRPLDEKNQLQNRLDTNRPFHGRSWRGQRDQLTALIGQTLSTVCFHFGF